MLIPHPRHRQLANKGRRWIIHVALYGVLLCINQAYAQDHGSPRNALITLASVDDAFISTKNSLNNTFFMDFPVVVTPMRLKQAIADVPAAISLIEGSTIRQLGLRNIPEILRLVPGITVRKADGINYQVSYHGTNGHFPRRMQVMLDGMSLYAGLVATVDWREISVSVEDIERIEITRSPVASVYGTNAFSGIVNIISKDPSDMQEHIITSGYGSTGIRNFRFQSGNQSKKGHYSLRLQQEYDHGFNGSLKDYDEAGSIKATRLNYHSQQQIDNNNKLDVRFKYVNGAREFRIDDFGVGYIPPTKYVNSIEVMVDLNTQFNERHELHWQATTRYADMKMEWNACMHPILLSPELNRLFLADSNIGRYISDSNVLDISGFNIDDLNDEVQLLALDVLFRYGNLEANGHTEVCVEANQNGIEKISDIELQDTFILSPKLRLVSVIGFSRVDLTSETYMNGSDHNRSARLLSSFEYSPTDKLRVNGGAMIEKDRLSGSVIAPRLALNYHWDKHQTFRTAISKGTRTLPYRIGPKQCFR